MSRTALTTVALSILVLAGCDRDPERDRRAPEPTAPPSLAGALSTPLRAATVRGAVAGLVHTLEPQTAGADASRDAPDTPTGSCEPRRVLRTVAEPDRTHATRFRVVDFDKVAYIVSSDGQRSQRLVAGDKQHTDMVPHVDFQMLADGRPVYIGTDGLGRYVSIDGARDDAHEDVWYVEVDATGQHVTYAALREGRWSAVTDGQPVGGWHDGVDYPQRLTDGTIAMTVTDGGRERLVRVDPASGLFPTRSAEAAGEVSRGRARVDPVDGTHLLTTARPADGKKRRLVLLDDQVLADCKEAVALGFAPRSTTPLYACQDDDGWTLHAGDTSLGGPWPTRPRVHYAEGPRAQGADAPHVILAGGIAELGGERVIDDASYIYEARVSPDGERVAMLVEHDLARVHLVMFDLASGQRTDWQQALPVKAPDVELGSDWGHFSPDGRHFAFAYAGRVVVDDTMRVDQPGRAAVYAVTNAGDALYHHETTLRLGDRVVADDVVAVIDTRLEDDGRLRWAAWTGTDVVAGCVEPTRP